MGKAKVPEFEVGYVDIKKAGVFRELISDEAENRLMEGEPLSLIGLTHGKFAAGAAAFGMEEDHVEIISFYVMPSFRKKGGGSKMLSAIEAVAAELESWVSASFLVVNDETRALEAFFESREYDPRRDLDYKSYLVTLGECEESDTLRKVKKDKKLKYFSELTENKLKSYTKQAETRLAPLPVGGFLSPNVDRELSVVYEVNGRMEGFLAIEEMDYENGIRLAAAFNGTENPMVLMWLVKAALSVAQEKFDEHTPLLIDVVDETADRFVRYVLDDVEAVSRTYDKVPVKG